jgi:membrane protein, marC family
MLEAISFKQIVTCFLALFPIIDAVGSVPIFVNLRKKTGKIEAEKAIIAASVIMLVFLFFGDKMLEIIGLDINSFAIAGAFVIFIIALEMILGIDIHKAEEMKSASIIPIAFPLVAGVGALAEILLLRTNKNHEVNIVIAILLNILFVYIILKTSDFLSQKISEETLMVLKKAFGIILLAISVKMFMTNLLYFINTFSNQIN